MKRRDLLMATGLSAALLQVQSVVAKGRPVRVVLLVGGEYDRYRHILIGFAKGLQSLGLIQKVPPKLKTYPTLLEVWTELVLNAGGDKIQFLPGGLYNYEFDPSKREAVFRQAWDRIEKRREVDMVFAFGTEPSLDLHAVRDIPVISLGSTDPVQTGIVKSAEDSGQDNLHAIVLKDYFRQQLELFHAIWPFKHLGVVVSEQRYPKSGAVDLQEACQDHGIAFYIKQYYEDEMAITEDRFPAFWECLTSFLDEEPVDALMLPWFPSTDAQFMQVVDLLVKRRIPCYSIGGVNFVASGLVLGASDENFSSYGHFEANVVRRVIKGEKPRDISQIFVDQNRVAINLRTAMRMGWQVPFNVLAMAEKVYMTQKRRND